MHPVSIAPLVISALTMLAPYAKNVAGKLIEKAKEEKIITEPA